MADNRDLDATAVALANGRTVFGRYVLERIIGRGGMGVVWLARDKNLDLPVALKFLPDAVRADPDALHDLRRETKRALRLTHENIVRVHTLEEDASSIAIVMEYVDSQSLAVWKSTLPDRCAEPAVLLPLVRQLCTALSYAHEKAGVIHRDLKPGNLLLAKDGTLKITDFGIARCLSETQTRLTGKSSQTSGTLLYMSPQQLMGERPTPADDIYSLGATLYELLTGKPPFYTGDVFMQVREKAAPSVKERRSEFEIKREDLAINWEKTISACLAKLAAERPKSTADVLVGLEAGTHEASSISSHTGSISVSNEPATAGELTTVPDEHAHGCTSTREPVPGREWTVVDLGMRLLPVEPGTFSMGSAGHWLRLNEEPATRVLLSDWYWLGRFPVTQREYAAVVGINPSAFSVNGHDKPVEQVSWSEAMEFCRRLTERDHAAGKLHGDFRYTLPTEAEWEYACRAGAIEDSASIAAVAWFRENSQIDTSQVGAKLPNAWGFHDMLGNVWEWCSDWYAPRLPGGEVRNPQGPTSGIFRVNRGGGWNSPRSDCRFSRRDWDPPGRHNRSLGFRVVLKARAGSE